MAVATAQEPFTRRTIGKTGRSALIVSLVAVLAAAGCSSSSSSKAGGAGASAATGASSGASGSSTGGGGGDAVAAATKLLAAAASSAVTGPSAGAVTDSQIVPWTASMMPTAAALPQGKKISVDIVYGLAVGEGPYLAKLTAAIATKLGWSAKIIQAASQSQQGTLAAVQQALLDKPTAIIDLVIPAVWVGGALAKAKSAGIYTIDVHQDSTDGPGYDALVPAAEGIQKSLMAAYAIKASGGKASTLLFDAPGFSDANMPAAKTYLDTCSGCKTTSLQLNPLDFTDPVKVQSDVTATLASHPGVNYLMWPNASLPIQPVVTAIRNSANKNAQLIVNGLAPAPVALVKAGAVPMMAQIPDALLSLVALDDVSRLVQKMSPIAEDALRLPISYWTPSNVPNGQDFSTLTQAQLSNDFVTPYEKAWGMSLRDTILSIKS